MNKDAEQKIFDLWNDGNIEWHTKLLRMAEWAYEDAAKAARKELASQGANSACYVANEVSEAIMKSAK